MTVENPFPGMNPFLQRRWGDVHVKLIAYIADALAERLPPDLTARGEEQVTLHGAEGWHEGFLRPDAAVVEPLGFEPPSGWQPRAEADVAVAEPLRIPVPEETERWVEIRTIDGRVITVIEVLSPHNKERGASDYRSRQKVYLRSDVNLVEIDLFRGGQHVLAFPVEKPGPPPAGTRYLVSVARAADPTVREVYQAGLRDPLPNIRVPLRPGENDVVLELKPLIDRCYRMGRYWMVDHQSPLDPPLTGDEVDWVGKVLARAKAEAR